MTAPVCQWCRHPTPDPGWWDGQPQCRDPHACDRRRTTRHPGAAMTPADEIQTAVTKLHKLLTDPQLTPAPWQSTDRGDRILWNGPGADDLPPRYVVDEPMSNSVNADWIAVMHPAVGAALANWLAATAAHLTASTHPDWQDCVAADALAVARAILGTQETP